MALQGPFAVYLENGQQVLKPLPKQSGGGNGNTIINTSGGIPVLQVQTITTTPGQIQGVKARNLLVRVQLAALQGGDIVLPPLASTDVGARITIVRESGDPFRVVASTNADQVNGITTATFTPYTFRSLQDAVTYLRVPQGWQREQGTPVGTTISSAVSPIEIPPAPEGTQYVFSRIAGSGAVAELPSVQLCRTGYRVVISNAGSSTLTITPAVGERINRTTDAYVMPSESSAIFEVSDTATGAQEWIAIQQNEDPLPIVSSDAIVTLTAWRGFGRQSVTLTGADQTVNLPLLSTLANGAEVLVLQEGTGSALVVPAGADEVNGQDRRSVLQSRATLLRHAGNRWIATDGARYLTPQTSATDPTTIPAWVDSPFFYESTSAVAAHVINLPALAGLQYGAHLILFNNSAESATLTPDGAELVNDSGTLAIPANSTASVYKRDATNWIAVVSA